MQSEKYSLNKEDLISIGTTLAMVAGAAIVTKLLEIVPNLNVGQYSEVLITILVLLLKTAQKYFQGK